MAKAILKEKIGGRIREFAEEKFKTSKRLAEALGMIPQTLQLYISGRAVPGGEIIKRLAELGADVHYILTGERMRKKIKEETINELSLKPGSYEFPIVNDFSSISSPKGMDFQKKVLIGNNIEKIAFTYHKHSGCFAFIVKGDRMSPTLLDCDIILLDCDAKLYEGCVAAALLKSGEQIVHRYRKLSQGMIQLNPDNFLYEPVTIKKNQIGVLFPVVKVQRNLFRMEKR